MALRKAFTLGRMPPPDLTPASTTASTCLTVPRIQDRRILIGRAYDGSPDVGVESGTHRL